MTSRCRLTMANALGTQHKGSVNVELNVVPFIDLMSCMTAFLLITAVWIDLAHLRNDPAACHAPSKEPAPRLTILLEADQIVVSATPSGLVRTLAVDDWRGVEAALKELADEPRLVEVAGASSAAHPISYQTLIAAMDTAIRAGFPDVGVVDPSAVER